MSTVDQTIDSALRMVGLIGPGHSASSGSSGLRSVAIDILNTMLKAWALDGINVPCEAVTEFTVTASTSQYTVGSGADIDISRPNRVRCTWKADDRETPLAELTDQEYSAWADKTTEGRPVAYHYASASPTGTISLLPPPDTGDTLCVYRKQPFTAYAAGTDTINLPDFEEAIRCNLALRFLSELSNIGAKMDPMVYGEVKHTAANGKADIRRLNYKTPSLESDFPSRQVPLSKSEFESGVI